MTDIEYIHGFITNNEDVIADFYRLNKGFFFSFFRNAYGKSDEYLTDLYQDSCVVLWQNIHDGKLRPDNLSSTLQTYLISVGKYSLLATDRKFKEITDDKSIEALAFVPADTDELREQIEREEFVDSLMKQLKSPCSEVLTAFYWEKLSCEQIAQKFGYVSADSAKTQKYKCLSKLKALVKRYSKD